MISKAVKAEVEGVKAEIARLSAKVARRIEELENKTIEDLAIIYSDDASIREALERIQILHNKGREICRRHRLTDGACREFNSEPRIFRELALCEACARARVYLRKSSCNGREHT